MSQGSILHGGGAALCSSVPGWHMSQDATEYLSSGFFQMLSLQADQTYAQAAFNCGN